MRHYVACHWRKFKFHAVSREIPAGVSKASLITYSFLVEHDILARLGTIQVQKWKETIHTMLQRIPEVFGSYEKEDIYCNSIKSRLFQYKHLQDALPLLELALWKAKIIIHSNDNISNVKNNVKMMCRDNSF